MVPHKTLLEAVRVMEQDVPQVKDLPVLDRVVVVLDRPQHVANVGAVVRLMGNFGLSHLRLVEPAAWDAERIQSMARRGSALLSQVERYASVEEAVADCSLLLGTTSRPRSVTRPVLTPRQAAAVLLDMARAHAAVKGTVPSDRSAVLFGPENFGLAASAIDRCHALIRIPTVPDDASLNLAQAALLVAYELFLAAQEQSGPAEPAQLTGLVRFMPEYPPATSETLDHLMGAFVRMVAALHEQAIAGRTAMLSRRVRALLLRAVPSATEAELLVQVFEHAARRLQPPSGTIDRYRSED
jgi:TrmH family RNA methyltransferase